MAKRQKDWKMMYYVKLSAGTEALNNSGYSRYGRFILLKSHGEDMYLSYGSIDPNREYDSGKPQQTLPAAFLA